MAFVVSRTCVKWHSLFPSQNKDAAAGAGPDEAARRQPHSPGRHRAQEKDEFNNDESGENSSNNNNLSVNKPDKNNKPITNIPVLNVKNSDLHEYSLEFLKNKTPYEIMLNSNTSTSYYLLSQVLFILYLIGFSQAIMKG